MTLLSAEVLRSIVRDRLSINASTNSKGDIPKSAAIFSSVPNLGSAFLLNHSDQFLISIPVKVLSSLYVKFKNSSLPIALQTYISATILLVNLKANKTNLFAWDHKTANSSIANVSLRGNKRRDTCCKQVSLVRFNHLTTLMK